MQSVKAKTGRKAKPYVTSWGETINGLYKSPDGRWRITSTDEKFTEADERLAVLKFRQWEAKRDGSQVRFKVPLSAPELALVEPDEEASGFSESMGVLRQFHFLDQTDPAGPDIKLDKAIPEAILWGWFRQQLLHRPKYVAEQTGIEQIGYLADLPKPTPSPALEAVGDLYFAKLEKRNGKADNWLAKNRQFWREFRESVGVETLREVTQGHILDYADMVTDAAKSPTYSRQRFGAIKAIVNYPPKRGKWAEDCKRVSALCAVLVPPKKAATDPQPIDRQHFQALLDAADDQMKAILLVSLNACMYGGETAALDWSEVNLETGVLVTHREKTGIVRIAMLWPRTVEAIRKMPRTTDNIFTTSGTRMQHNYQTIYKAFKALRVAAGVTGVQFSHIRDGAYTTAVQAGVDINACKLLAGHATGISDHYVKRRPQMVAVACEAIHAAYFG